MKILTPAVTANAARQPHTTRSANRAREGCEYAGNSCTGGRPPASSWLLPAYAPYRSRSQDRDSENAYSGSREALMGVCFASHSLKVSFLSTALWVLDSGARGTSTFARVCC